MLIPGFINGFSQSLLLEITGAFYLIIVYFLIRIIRLRDFVEKALSVFIYSALIAGIIGISGWVLFTFFKIETTLVYTRLYPYFGEIAQVRAFSGKPNMLASILVPGIIFQTSFILRKQNKRNIFDLIILFLLLLAMLLTVSKSIVPLIAGILFVGYFYFKPSISNKKKSLYKWALLTSIVLLTLVYTAGTHFYISDAKSHKLDDMNELSYIQITPTATFQFLEKQIGIYPTSYYLLKEAAIKSVVQTKGMGLGAGNFNRYIGNIKKEGRYPINFPDYDPHSTYSGTLAENGVSGFIILLLFFGFIWHMSVCNIKSASSSIAPIALSGSLVAIAIIAIASDVMNYRHFWWVFGLTAAFYAKNYRNKHICNIV